MSQLELEKLQWDFTVKTAEAGTLFCTYEPYSAYCEILDRFIKSLSLQPELFQIVLNVTAEESQSIGQDFNRQIVIQHVVLALEFLKELMGPRLNECLRELLPEAMVKACRELERTGIIVEMNIRNKEGGMERAKVLVSLPKHPDLEKILIENIKHEIDKRGLVREGRPAIRGTIEWEFDQNKKRTEFRAEIVEAIRSLKKDRERITKAAVAKKLNIGGKYRTQSLTNKLKRVGLNFDKLMEELDSTN